MKRRVCVVLSAFVGSLALTVFAGPLSTLSAGAAEAADCRYTNAPLQEILIKGQFNADRAAAGVSGRFTADRNLLPLVQDRALRRVANQRVGLAANELGARNHRFSETMGFTGSGNTLAELHQSALSSQEGKAAVLSRGVDRIALTVLRARADGCVPLLLEGLVRGL